MPRPLLRSPRRLPCGRWGGGPWGRSSAGAAACLLLSTLAAGCAPAVEPPETSRHRPGAAEGERLSVVASIPPLAYLAERLGGPGMATAVLLPPSGDHHGGTVSPAAFSALARADLLVAVGHAHLPSEARLLDLVAERRPELPVVTLQGPGAGDVDSPRAGPSPGPGAGPAASSGMHHAVEDDPHLWLSPAVVRAAAVELSAALAGLDGEPAGPERLARFLADLDAAEAALDRALGGAAGPEAFLTQHPAWGRLAAPWGIEQLAVERESGEASPRRLVELARRSRAEGLRVVLVSPGAPSSATLALARATGVRLVPVDPLARDLLDTYRRLAAALAPEAPDA